VFLESIISKSRSAASGNYPTRRFSTSADSCSNRKLTSLDKLPVLCTQITWNIRTVQEVLQESVKP
jgi:hypothetical protein